MKSILETCVPRPDLLQGSFNPEIFTANLGEVIQHYQNQSAAIDSIYTNAEEFFGEATFPTASLRQLLADVFGRLGGDNSRPALHRLETAFGGGKTHALIACTHVAYKGTELADVTSGIVDSELLPDPGEISVVGVRGDEIPVNTPKGKALIPYTLWGDIAYQIGGEDLYKQVGSDVASHAAPGKPFFDTVFGGRKALVLLDELAQYAARLQAARPDGGTQLAAFLFALHGYARTHAGIAVVVTLAGQADAFASETKRLTELLSEVRGQDVREEEAISLGQQAVDEVESVAFRDTAPGLVPVHAAELSKVLSQRLLLEVDRDAARAVAEEYSSMYQKNAGLLPDIAVRPDYSERMIANYPFHPTIIDYLNTKLSTSENFHGTRGVLRVLALAIRSLWSQKEAIPMIHACHLYLRDSATANELLGRTGSSDLLPVLDADIGGPNTVDLEARSSNAEEADRRNPHPEGFPMHEYVWKTVFLHSLVGQEEGLSSNVFGLTEPNALLEASFPGLTPPQVKSALEQIEEIDGGAFYLRHESGRYYASKEPSLRAALRGIWNSLKSQEERVQETLKATARKVVSTNIQGFHVEHDVHSPEHIPDDKERPILALVSLDAGEIDVDQFIVSKGSANQVRERQNLVFLLVPDTVIVKQSEGPTSMFPDSDSQAEEALAKLQDSARWALAIQELKNKPQDYGINQRLLDEDEFKKSATERVKALETSVTQAYRGLWFSSARGGVVEKEIKTAGGESGSSVVEVIRNALLEDNELLTRDHVDQATLMNLQSLFFEHSETPALEEIRKSFMEKRGWPVIESPETLDVIVRAGVEKGLWCIFQMESEDSANPDEFFDRESELPLNLNLWQKPFFIIQPSEARKRGWGRERPDPNHVQGWIKDEVADYKALTVGDLASQLRDKHGDLHEQDVSDALNPLLRQEALMAYQNGIEPSERPQLIFGQRAILYSPSQTDVVITKAEAARRGWLTDKPDSLSLSGRRGAEVLFPLLRRIGSLYNRGATSFLNNLELTELALPKGGTLSIAFHDVSPESAALLGEFLETAENIASLEDKTEGFLEVADPSDDCIFVKEIRKEGGEDTSERGET